MAYLHYAVPGKMQENTRAYAFHCGERVRIQFWYSELLHLNVDCIYRLIVNSNTSNIVHCR